MPYFLSFFFFLITNILSWSMHNRTELIHSAADTCSSVCWVWLFSVSFWRYQTILNFCCIKNIHYYHFLSMGTLILQRQKLWHQNLLFILRYCKSVIQNLFFHWPWWVLSWATESTATLLLYFTLHGLIKEISQFFPLVSFELDQSRNMWYGYLTNKAVLEDLLQECAWCTAVHGIRLKLILSFTHTHSVLTASFLHLFLLVCSTC